MVHALPSRSAHKLGLEDGLGCPGWKASQSEAASSTSRSSQVLTFKASSCFFTTLRPETALMIFFLRIFFATSQFISFEQFFFMSISLPRLSLLPMSELRKETNVLCFFQPINYLIRKEDFAKG